MAYSDLRFNQKPCYDKALNKDKFLIAAKPRYGKTYVATELVGGGWNCKLVVVLSGKNVRQEWRKALISSKMFDHVITTNEELNRYDLGSRPLNNNESYAFFVSMQKAGRNIYDGLDTEGFDSNIDLINRFNEYAGGRKAVIVDEAHFAEQTSRSQTVLEEYKTNKTLYLSGTPYTTSITKQFDAYMTFRYSYVDEYNDYKAGLLDYTPIFLDMYVVDCVNKLNDDVQTEWSILLSSDEAKTKLFSKTFSALNQLNSKNNMILCDSVRNAEIIINDLKKIPNVKVKSAAGNVSRLTSENADRFYKENPNTINFIVTCDRLTTGSTIRELQSVLFYCSTKSAIRFIQTSMRPCSPYEDETREKRGHVLCFNKFGAYQVYNTLVSLEKKDKQSTNPTQADFDDMQDALPLYEYDETLDKLFKKVEYADATNFEAMYVHGKTKFFTDIETFDDLVGFSLAVGSIEKLKGISSEVKEALKKAAKEHDIEATRRICAENKIELQEVNLEETRKLMQECFTNVIEEAIYQGAVQINEDKSVTIDYSGITELILLSGWENTDYFNNIVEEHPEYVRCIKNYTDVQMQRERTLKISINE